jgi:hypothetical protein
MMASRNLWGTKRSTGVSKYDHEGRNGFGQHRLWLTTADVDALVAKPYAVALLNWLKAHNKSDSTVADGLADTPGWARRQFKNARQYLIDAGWNIALIRPRPGHPVLCHWEPSVFSQRGTWLI